MNDQRFLTAIFCDDIRSEVGNKLTLVGCYSADLLLTHLPTTLPKFGVHVRMYTPVSQPVLSLRLRVFLNAEMLGELAVDSDQLAQSANADVPADANWRVMTAVLMLTPFNVTEAGDLRVEAETESGPLIPARLKIKVLDPYDAQVVDEANINVTAARKPL